MSSFLGSQGLVLATAMAVSAGTIILFDLVRDKYFPATQLSPDQDSHSQKQVLKSCLSSGRKKGEQKKKKRRVQFAADVKDPRGNGEEYRRGHRKLSGIQRSSCGTEVLEAPAMPANRLALYSGILKDRLHRIEFSY